MLIKEDDNKEASIMETDDKKLKYIKRGAVVGDSLGWLGLALPLPLFILFSAILALIGGGIGFIAYLTRKRIKKHIE